MPKDRRVNSPSYDRAMVTPYACSLNGTGCNDHGSSLPLVGDEREWEEVRCPICMEHPHNAVLLQCSSQEKGCRPFMCDTSYRHSNCLDQYRNAPSPTRGQKSDLVCPLCRGRITGWVVNKPARRFMDSNKRCCSLESCSFIGNYTELRKHARLQHPADRPSEASATRQTDWTTLERQVDINDALVHQFDFEDAWDGWPTWDELGDADFWSDGTFFDFPIEEMSDLDDEMFGSLPLSDVTLYSSSPEMEIEWDDSEFFDFSREYDLLHMRFTPADSSPGSNNQSPLTNSRSTSMYQRENDLTISERSPISQSQGRNPLFIPRSTSSYPMENNSNVSGSNPRSNNGVGNSFSVSRSAVRHDTENNPTNSGSRSSYRRENYVTYSRSRSRSRSRPRPRSRSRSRPRPSYNVENASVNSRTRSNSRTRQDAPLARRAEYRDLPALSRRLSP